MEQRLSLRELSETDIPFITDYWLNSEPDFMRGMGVALEKLPSRAQWEQMLEAQLSQPYEEKQSYCLVWLIDGRPSGHCNVNKIVYGEEAYMHLHLWQQETRKKGAGRELVRLSIPHFFEKLRLKKLYCEPYALNPAPNKTLPLLGFRLVRTYVTTPGFICFEQPVCLWELTSGQWSARQHLLPPGKG